jgi:TonB family protein
VVSNLVAFSAQAASVGLLATVLPLLLRIDVAAVRYAYWRATLAICLLLPFLPARYARTAGGRGETLATITSFRENGTEPLAMGGLTASAVDWSAVLLVVLLAGITMRMAWLAIGLVRVRRLYSTGEVAPDEDHRELQQRIGTDAQVRYTSSLTQPVTFGVRPAVVLLPDALRSAAPGIRDAVLAHELIHVRRRDWAWVLSEEFLRAVVWFHPVLWWLISRVQLAREEVVDVEAISVTGSRKTYVEALLAFADGSALTPAPGFARRRHLFQRIVLISKEGAMSGRRLVVSAVVMAVVMVGGAWYATAAFPLVEASQPAALLTAPGPLEQTAVPITPENPIPRRVRAPEPITPSVIAAASAITHVTLRTVLDNSGRVAELRLGALSIKSPVITLEFDNPNIARMYEAIDELERKQNAPVRQLVDAVVAAAVAAVQQSQYDAPFQGPIAFDTTISFAPGRAATRVAEMGSAPKRQAVDPSGAIRVGGNVKVPEKIKNVSPVYPPDAMAAKIQGVVIVEARIEGDGTVGEVKVLRSIPALDQSAIDAVKQWEFRPTLLNGAPVPVIVTMTVQFSLK